MPDSQQALACVDIRHEQVFLHINNWLKILVFEAQAFTGFMANAALTAIMGSSGSGKTTLLRIITGSIEPTDGQVWVNGVNLMRLSQEERQKIRNKMAIVFQHGALFDSLTAWENIAFPICDCSSVSMDEARREAENLLDMFDQGGSS